MFHVINIRDAVCSIVELVMCEFKVTGCTMCTLHLVPIFGYRALKGHDDSILGSGYKHPCVMFMPLIKATGNLY